jgi:hypothetical protein
MENLSLLYRPIVYPNEGLLGLEPSIIHYRVSHFNKNID